MIFSFSDLNSLKIFYAINYPSPLAAKNLCLAFLLFLRRINISHMNEKLICRQIIYEA